MISVNLQHPLYKMTIQKSGISFCFGAKVEPIKPYNWPDIGKCRFGNVQAHGEDDFTGSRIDLTFYIVGETIYGSSDSSVLFKEISICNRPMGYANVC